MRARPVVGERGPIYDRSVKKAPVAERQGRASRPASNAPGGALPDVEATQLPEQLGDVGIIGRRPGG